MLPSAQPPAVTTRFDAKAFRRALGRFPTGVTVVTTRGEDGGFVGLTANSFNSVSLEPPLVLWSIGKQQTSLPVFRQAGVFAVNVLAADQIALSQRFASPVPDRFRDIPTFKAETGAPLLEGTSAWFDCALHHSYDGGDHLIFVGRVLACHAEARPALVYADGQYGVPSRHPLAPARTARCAPDLPPQEFVADYLSYLLAKASALVSAEFHARVRDAGLSVPEWRVLATLSDGQHRGIGQLAAIVLTPQPTLTRLIDRMEQSGHVTRATGPTDRRQTLVGITEDGMARVAGLLLDAKTHEAELGARPGLEGMDALKRTLRELIDRMA